MKTLRTIINEGSDLRCQNCGDNLGKATENSKKAYCGTCGSTTNNPAGYNHTSSDSTTENNKQPEVASSFPNLKDGIKHGGSHEPNYTIHIKNLQKKKVIDHGNGIISVTSKYSPHQATDLDNKPLYPGVSHAITHVYRLEQNDKTRYPKGWDSLNNIGHIQHARMPDGTEHHTIIHGHSLSGNSLVGGQAKSLYHGAHEIGNMHKAKLAKTHPSENAHYEKTNKNVKIGFAEAKNR